MPVDPWDYDNLAKRMAETRRANRLARSASPSPHQKILRNMLIVKMRDDGVSLAEIADTYGISCGRVRFILRRHLGLSR
jgi:hypothetical protein